MLKMFIFLCLLLFSFILQAQEKIQGVELAYIPKNGELEKAGLKVGDIILSYANFPITEEKMLLGIDKFLIQLEQQWKKEGKAEDFWKKKSEWIKKKTRGTIISPVAFSENKPIEPFYKVVVRKKQKKGGWIEQAKQLRSGLFIHAFQENKQLGESAFQFYQQGLQALQQQKFVLALECFKQSLKLGEQAGELTYIATNLSWIGSIYQQTGKVELALEYHLKSLKLFERIGDINEIANSLNTIASLYEGQGKSELALKHYLNSLKLFEQTSNYVEMANTLNNIGLFYKEQGKLKLALKNYFRALKLVKEVGNSNDIAELSHNIGFIYYQQGKLELALEYYLKSLKLRENLRNPIKRGQSLNDIGLLYQQQGKLKLALEYYLKALKLIKQTGHSGDIATAFNNIGLLYKQQGKLELALEYYLKSLKLRESLKNPSKIAQSLNNVGLLYQQQGKLELALEYCSKSFKLAKQTENPSFIAINSNNIGAIYQQQGKLELALEYYLKSLKFAEQGGQLRSIATSFNNVADLYSSRGKLEKALEYHLKSLKLAKQIGSPSQIANSLNNIGALYQEQGKLELALDYYLKALALAEQVGNPSEIATLLNNIGFVYRLQERFELALECQLQSLKLIEQVGNPSEIAQSLNNLGGIYLEQEKLELALKHFLDSLRLIEQVGEPQTISKICFNLGIIYRGLDEEKAIEYSLRAIKNIKFVANQSGSGRQDFLKTHLSDYYQVIEYLIKQKRTKEAFEMLQQFKAFGFLTKFSELKLNLEQYVSKELLEQRNSLIEQTSALYKLVAEYSAKKNISATAISDFKQQLSKKEEELTKIIDKIRFGNPAFGNIEYPEASTLKEIQSTLNSNELLLEYFSTYTDLEDLLGETYCFAITKDSHQVLKLAKTSILTKKVNLLRCVLWETQEDEEPNDYYEQALTLYNTLIQPIFDQLENKKVKRIIIAPDGILNFLPFEALCLPQTEEPELYQELNYLIDRYEISYSMSATVYKFLSEHYSKSTDKKQSLKLFGLGDPFFKASEKSEYKSRVELPSLPGTRKELNSIGKLLNKGNTHLLFGKEAIEPALFLADLLQYKIFHFATHGLIEIENPMYSSLAFTPLTETQQKQFEAAFIHAGLEAKSFSDGFLQVRDIFTLHKKIDAQLVVLSACETGTGKIERGDGIIGLTRAFQFAGTPSIIVSLWSVSDESTSLLMQYFYQKLLKDNPTSLTGKRLIALHYAKKKLRHSEEYSAPYYWAPFVLRGLP